MTLIEERIRRVVELASGLLAVPSVVGFERPLLDRLGEMLAERGLGVRRTHNLVVGAGRGGHRTVLSAHVDRHGLICTGPNRFGYAAHVLPASRGLPPAPRHAFATVVCTRFADEPVRAYDPSTGRTIAEGLAAHGTVCGVEELGVEVPVRGLEAVKLGVPVAFVGRCTADDGTISGQLDNALTAAMALLAVEDGFDGTVAFTAEEEIGNSWRFLAEDLLALEGAPEALLVLDTSPFPDDGPAPPGSVVLRRADATAGFDTGLVARLHAAADAVGATVVVKDELIRQTNEEREAGGLAPRGLGRTELGRLIAGTSGRLTGATLQVPTTGYHTNNETAALEDVAAAVATLWRMLELA